MRDQVVGNVEPETRVHGAVSCARNPAAQGPVGRHGVFGLRRSFYHAVLQRGEYLGEGHRVVEGEEDDDEGDESGADDQHDLYRVDVEQSLDAAGHGVDRAHDAEDDDGVHQEPEVYRPEDDDAHGDRRDEEPRSRGEELTEDEHHARGPFRRFAEAVADIAVDGDGPGIVEFRQEKRGHPPRPRSPLLRSS